ncbi:hypothetical protein RJ639_047076 [Escallonia herrerae]|uniref:Uncharacterized protein n=1 Tax=Escallonia herrerae TaxID=1293975 RepID=A0AA88W7K6_9ASTE|nr:hypothetical protein RJ639_047076 [Escallonia herrerae]
MILLRQNRARPVGTLLGQSVWKRFCSEQLPPSSSQPSTSQPSPSLPTKNVLGDVKDQAEDEANPKPWYTADKKSSKMSTEDLVELLREYPLPVDWYARLPGLQEPANYGTKYETGIYEEQVKSGYRLPLHPFALHFFEHYHMAPRQLVLNGWRKLVGLIYLVQTSGYKLDATDFMRVFFKICFVKGVANCPGWYYIHSRQRLLKGGPKSNKAGAVTFPPAPTISSTFPAESASLEMASGSGKAAQGGFLIVEKVSVEEDPIFHPRWTLRSDDMYASGSEMLSLFEMTRQVAAKEAQQKREAVKEAEEATHRAEELSIIDFLDGNAGNEWLKKRADDGLEIYELGFVKAKEMFVERFPDISLDDIILPAVISPSGETVLPLEAGDATASHPPGEGPSGNAPEH